MATKVTTSQKINAIRLAAGWDGRTCTTCCRPVGQPYRLVGQDGRVVHGCIDSSHEEHAVGAFEYTCWFNRPAAEQMRRDVLAHLRSLGSRRAARANQPTA